MKPEPECGVDFCERCGDCIACYGDDPCLDGNTHVWPALMEAIAKMDAELATKEAPQ